MSMHIDCFDDDEDKLVLNENDDIEAVLNDNDDIEVVLNDNDDIEVVLDDSEGIEVVLNDSNDIEVVLDSSAITWSEINGDLRKNKAIVEFLNNLPMLPDIPVEGEYILKAIEGNEFWEEDNLATRDELALAKEELQAEIDIKQDKGDYATNESLNTAKEELQANIDTKQDKGDYALKSEIPSITHLATKEEVELADKALTEAVAKLDADKQDKGDYAVKSDLIPLATKEELSSASHALQNKIDEKQDRGDYATNESLNTAKEELQANIDTKQDKGDYALKSEIPDVTPYATKTELTEGLNTKQDKGDYVTKTQYDQTNESFQNALNNKQDAGDYVTNTELESKGYLTSYTEIDPVYTADKPNLALKSELPDLAPYATKEELNRGLAGKQEAGDYALKSEIPTNNNQLENGAGYVTADYHDSTKQDVIDDLDEIRSGAELGATALQSYTETDPVYTADKPNIATKDELTEGLDTKQDIISDLETIRDGALKGSTALQSVPDEYITETELESKGYLTSYTETDPVYSADKPNLALKSEIPDISNLATKDEIPDISGKQDVISDLTTIRDGASKGATALQSIPSEYVTETELESKGYLTSYTETDPIYTADKPNLALKSELPTKVSSLINDANYQTATEVAQMIASIPQFEVKIVDELPSQGQKMILYLVPKTSAGGDNIYDEYIWLESTSSFELVGTTTVDLSNYYTKEEINQSLNNKQDVITDLDTIRDGASKGATALQSVPSEYITETELNNKGYLTSYTEIDPIYTADKPNIVTKDELTEGLDTKQDVISDLETIREGASKGSTALQEETDPVYSADKPNLALKSEIPTKTSQLTNDSDYITSEYHDSTKQDIISDLETIRDGASKGATALQSVPSEYITETELESKGYLTEHQDISNLATKEELTNGLSDKQDNLVDGINIKTINGTSILGEGNIKIEDTVYTAGTDIQIDNNIISVCEPVEYGLGEWNSIKNNTNFYSYGKFVNLIYGNNKYILQYNYYSDDGVNWKDIEFNIPGKNWLYYMNITNCVFDGEKFIFYKTYKQEDEEIGYLERITSTDLVTFSEPTVCKLDGEDFIFDTESVPTRLFITDIYFINGKIYLYVKGDGNTYHLYMSEDGINYTQVLDIQFISKISYVNNNLISFSMSDSNIIIYSSPDGVTWNTATIKAPFPFRYVVGAEYLIEYINGKYILACSQHIYSSTNLINWVEEGTISFNPAFKTKYNDVIYVSAYNNNYYYIGDIYKTTDCINFELDTSVSGGISCLKTFGDKMFCIHRTDNEYTSFREKEVIKFNTLKDKANKSEIPDISNLATKEELTTGLSDKQDVISDLTTIREGASKGATALQSIPSEYITETELESKGYLTNIPSEYITETELESKGYLTEHQDISNLATKQELITGLSGKQDILTQNAQATSSAISLVSNSNYYTIEPTSATTFTFPSVSAGKVYTFELKVTLSSVYSLTFPSSVVWMNGEAPDMSEAGVYFLVFRTDDGGNTWYGNSQGRWGGVAVTLTFTASCNTDTSFDISKCTLSLSASGYSQSGNSITVPVGTSVSYTCTATGMHTASGTVVADSTKTVNIPMTANVGCVLYNTEVLYADGTSKTAEEVQAGDSIMTYNIETKQMEPDIVEAVIPNEKDDVIKITFEDDSYVELTSGHPLLSDHGWTSYDNTKTRRENLSGGEELSQLEVGDKIMTSAGSYIAVKSIEEEYSSRKQRVYDFMMKKNHNFFGRGFSCTTQLHDLHPRLNAQCSDWWLGYVLLHNAAMT